MTIVNTLIWIVAASIWLYNGWFALKNRNWWQVGFVSIWLVLILLNLASPFIGEQAHRTAFPILMGLIFVTSVVLMATFNWKMATFRPKVEFGFLVFVGVTSGALLAWSAFSPTTFFG